MAQPTRPLTEDQVNSIAQEFGKRLSGVFSSVEVRLFGSYLHNRANPNSDIDFAIVSTDFAGIDSYIALKILGRMKGQVNHLIEAIPFSPKELRDPDVGSLAYDVAQKNKLLFSAKK
jgi:predicted nucleotidyltransferase